MKDHSCTGRCSMHTDRAPNWRMAGITGVLLLLSLTPAWAGEAPIDTPPASEVAADSEHRVEEPGERRDWHLDTAVFTEISPVTATEIAIKLPKDQQEEG